MLNNYIKQLKNDKTREAIKENVYSEQFLDLSSIKQAIEEQVQVLEKLKADILSDKNNPFADSLVEAINNKIKQIRL